LRSDLDRPTGTPTNRQTLQTEPAARGIQKAQLSLGQPTVLIVSDLQFQGNPRSILFI